LPFAAIAVGASLVRADDRVAPTDGIGALLRYVATSRLADNEPSLGVDHRAVGCFRDLTELRAIHL